MFTDAYDVLFFKNRIEILKLFKKFNANIVFGAEQFLTPEIDEIHRYPRAGKGGEFDKNCSPYG